jgi:hypothetical protein
MKNVCVDSSGELRCYNCGSKGFTEKRTMRAKLLVGVGAMLTKKKLKCQVCGEYNDSGSADPYTGPAAKKYRKMYESELAAASSSQISETSGSGQLTVVEQLSKLVDLLSQGAITQAQFDQQRDQILSA